jgi:hypothetical protein
VSCGRNLDPCYPQVPDEPKLPLTTYEHERLFNEGLKAGYAVSPLPARNSGMPVSAPERAILEHLAASVQSEMLHEGNASLVGMNRPGISGGSTS